MKQTMEESPKVSRITAFVNRNVSRSILEALGEICIKDLSLSAGRAPTLRDKERKLALFSRNDLVNDPLDIISFLVAPEMEDPMLHLIIDRGDLSLPGRGSAFSEEITLLKAHEDCRENTSCLKGEKKSQVRLQQLTEISCIVQRGQGDSLARIPLSTGSCVPAIHFGVGTGVRDKMGLLRITIPAEKEIILSATGSHDAQVIMDMMIEAGRLDQPGKGFIYMVPLRHGFVNLKVTYGEKRQAASIEQIVAALDHIRGGTEWRRWSGTVGQKTEKRTRAYMTGLADLTLLCNAGTGADLVKAAMVAGAPGATVSRLKHVRLGDAPASRISPARESCCMIIPESQIQPVTQALEAAGAFTDACCGQIQLRRVSKAFTYLGR